MNTIIAETACENCRCFEKTHGDSGPVGVSGKIYYTEAGGLCHAYPVAVEKNCRDFCIYKFQPKEG